MREEGIVTDYNGYEGEIKNENGIYALLRTNIHREDQYTMATGDLVEFEPEIFTNHFGSFGIAKSVKKIEKTKDMPRTSFKKRVLRKNIRIK